MFILVKKVSLLKMKMTYDEVKMTKDLPVFYTAWYFANYTCVFNVYPSKGAFLKA